ncbi:MAG: peptidoglycan-binding protein, partial [Candidatus Omnitrophica bacterium]|nr:peptidoglycan-binding protein [Candidatus Omnitrophota bacterium]
MHRSLLIGLILGLVLSGCATTESVSESELSRLRNRISVLEEELGQSQQKNLSLKEKIVALEQVVIKMPTAAEIQTALKNANFYQGEIDGQIGSDTKE